MTRSQSSWRTAKGGTFRTSFQEEAWKRYNRRMQEEYEEELERVVRKYYFILLYFSSFAYFMSYKFELNIALQNCMFHLNMFKFLFELVTHLMLGHLMMINDMLSSFLNPQIQYIIILLSNK